MAAAFTFLVATVRNDGEDRSRRLPEKGVRAIYFLNNTRLTQWFPINEPSLRRSPLAGSWPPRAMASSETSRGLFLEKEVLEHQLEDC